MPITKLSAKFAQEACCPPHKKKVDYYDKITKGLILEVRPSGGKTFYLKYTTPEGSQKQLKIGVFGQITFDQARRQAMKLRSQVVLGGDPAAKKTATKAVLVYAELAKQHLAYAKTYQKSWGTTEMYLRLHIIPRWGKVRLTDIKSQDIAIWLADKRGDGLAPATVEKIRVIFNRSFELALQWQIRGGETNPVRGVARQRINNARERFLTAAEVNRLLKACDASCNPQLSSIVRLLLLTGARKSELLNARWEHIDIARRSWFIPVAKTGKRHVPLSQDALDIIEDLPKFDGCPWLLPNLETRKPFVTIKRAWATARTEANLSDLRIHDLRHSAASFMINSGVNLFAVGKVLGHADHKSTMRYSHLSNDTLLAAVEAGAAHMKGATQ